MLLCLLITPPGNFFTYQLVLATTDLRLHSTFDPSGNTTASDVMQQQYAKIMVRGQGTCTAATCMVSLLACGLNETQVARAPEQDRKTCVQYLFAAV